MGAKFTTKKAQIDDIDYIGSLSIKYAMQIGIFNLILAGIGGCCSWQGVIKALRVSGYDK
jgi:hypothetical protein